jgi:hypothetical protein
MRLAACKSKKSSAKLPRKRQKSLLKKIGKFYFLTQTPLSEGVCVNAPFPKNIDANIFIRKLNPQLIERSRRRALDEDVGSAMPQPQRSFRLNPNLKPQWLQESLSSFVV